MELSLVTGRRLSPDFRTHRLFSYARSWLTRKPYKWVLGREDKDRLHPCCLSDYARTMSEYKVGDRLTVSLASGRIVEATVKAIHETTEGMRLQVSFGEETALVYLWQVVEKIR